MMLQLWLSSMAFALAAGIVGLVIVFITDNFEGVGARAFEACWMYLAVNGAFALLAVALFGIWA